MADADHFIRQLSQGYQTVLSERASNFSQGQRQVLSIARAVLADPVILILMRPPAAWIPGPRPAFKKRCFA
jgi:ATP-binding cassette subfamily B protein